MNKSRAESVSSWCYQRQAGSVKALQQVVWNLIFLVFGVHLANAEEQENKVHWVIADPRTFDENSQDGNLSILKRNSQREDPRTLKEYSQGGDLSSLEANSQGKDPRTFRDPVESEFKKSRRKRSGRRGRKKKVKKKKVMYRGKSVWKMCKERIANYFMAKRKEDVEMKGRKSDS